MIEPEIAAHMSAWDPARVLAECAAKRTVIADLVSCYGAGDMSTPVEPEKVESIRLMAAVYDSHPDFDPEWKVQG